MNIDGQISEIWTFKLFSLKLFVKQSGSNFLSLCSNCNTMYNSITEKRTLYYNFDNQIWSEGPEMLERRTNHGCSMFNFDSNPHLIVAGGENGPNILSSVEVYNLANQGKTWNFAPNLPQPIFEHKLVPAPDRFGVFAIGGVVDRNAVFEFKCSGTLTESCKWARKQDLEYGKRDFVAIPISS